jgi:hypothetical protein
LEITKIKVSHFTEEELRAQDESYLASLPKPKPPPSSSAAPQPEKSKQPKLTKEEETLRAKWGRVLDMVEKGRLEPLKVFWEREGSNLGGIDVPLPDWIGERAVTLLQLASQRGAEDVVRWLLDDKHADPCIDVPPPRGNNEKEEEDEADDGRVSDSSDAPQQRAAGSRKTAYDLARTKEVRNVFRRCAAAHPDWWDWFGAARVPSGLSKAMEDGRDEKKKIRRKGLKEKIKERDAREKDRAKLRTPSPDVVAVAPAKNEARPQDPTAPRKLGGSAGSVEGLAGLTPEMRAKIERERRARAAEARIKALSGR